MILLIITIIFLSPDTPAQRRSEVARPTLLVDQGGFALPDDPNNPKVGWEILESGENTRKWMAVGQLLRNGEPGCTAVLIKPPRCENPEKQKVQVVTNGHCTGENPNHKFSLRFGMFKDVKPSDRPEIGARALYSSQNKKDLGLLELDIDYQNLSRFGIQPLEVGDHFDTSQDLENVGIPLQGIASKDQVLRKNSHCRAGEQVTVIDMFRYFPGENTVDQCSVVGGSSGSGLFNKNGQLVGLMNAGTLDREPAPPHHACETDSCVYNGSGTPYRKKTNFGFDVTFLNHCYRDCRFDTTLPGCPLADPGSQVTTALSTHNDNWTPDLKRSITFEAKNYKNFQVKGCEDASTCRCEEAAGYQTLPSSKIISSGGKISATLKPADYFPDRSPFTAVDGAEPIFQFLCLRGQKKDGSWDALKNTTTFPLYLYKKPSSSLRPFMKKSN